MRGYPAEESEAPGGGMLMGLLDDRPVTGGAFRRFDDTTAELKRIWTDSHHRRRGHARALVTRLEAEITAQGYSRVYLSMGYIRLAEPLPAEGEVYPMAFAKALP